MFDPERQRRIRVLFEEALEQPADQRDAWLDRECGSDAALRAEVADLLAQDACDALAVDRPLLGTRLTAQRFPADADDRAPGSSSDGTPGPGSDAGVLPERIGRYRILGWLGAGGMGVVYRAEQDAPQRPVALKTLRPGLASRRTFSRFQTEIASLGRLRHPGIVQVYECGTAATAWGDQPYIAMELIEGLPLLEYIARDRPPLAERLALFAQLCDAVQFCHQYGVIHRDLKPANILVAAGPQPKVLDFGVSRLLDPADRGRTLATLTGEVVGTLAYMSPEQLDGPVDTRTDVYALGAVLYELLTGAQPIDLGTASLGRAAESIRNTPPRPLSAHDRALAGDLEVIVAKALEKDRERRYASVAALAEDVRRVLRCEPISARPPTLWYITRTYARRHRMLVGAGALVGAALLLGLVSTYYGLSRAEFESRQRQAIVSSAVRAVTRATSSALPKLNTLIGTAAVRSELLSEFERLNEDLRRVAGDDPVLLTARADLLEALSDLARIEVRFDDALRQRREALAIRQHMHELAPADVERARKLATALVLVGDVFGERGDTAESEKWYRDALAVQQRAAAVAAHDAGLLDDLVWSAVRLGNTARKQDRATEAEAHLREALELLAESERRNFDRRMLLHARQEVLGQLMLIAEIAAPESVEALLEQRLACLRELLALNPGDVLVGVRLMIAADGLAHQLVSRNECAAGRRVHDQCLSDLASQAALAEADVGWTTTRLWLELGRARLERAEGASQAVLARCGRIRAALDALPAAFAAADGPVHLRFALTYLGGQVADELGRRDLAFELYQDSITRLAAYADDPGSSGCAAGRLSALLMSPPADIPADLPRALEYSLMAAPTPIWTERKVLINRAELYRRLGDAEQAAACERAAAALRPGTAGEAEPGRL